jgi:hypothetical protein
VWLAGEMFDGAKLREVAVKLFLLPEDVPRGSRRAAAWRDRIVAEAGVAIAWALSAVHHAGPWRPCRQVSP